MISKLGLKRLTASDLTFFEWHFRNRNAGNQKAINLNADVFRDQLYPSVDIVARDRQNKLGVDLWIAGPAAAEPVNLQRKIIKGPTYKNWRLDGEFVYNPEDQPDRFNVLVPDDIALFGFEGELVPNTVTLVLVGSTAAEDQPLFEGLGNVLGNRRMMSLEVDALRELCERLPVSIAHPVWLLVNDEDEDVVEAASGLSGAVERLLKRRRPTRLSLDDLRKARQAAEEIGQLGEGLVDFYLKCRLDAREIMNYEWASALNAIAPYDFRIHCNDGSWEKFEIKTTAGNFGREYHLPRSELKDMASSGEICRIGRVYEATPGGAKMRSSKDLREFGQDILTVSSTLPPGVTLNDVTIVPDEALFGAEFVLSGPDED